MATKKRILLVAFAVIAVMILTISFTIAYMTDARTVVNEFEFGEVKIALHEDAWTKAKVKPGDALDKDPLVENVGSVPCYVRATVTVDEAMLGSNQSIMDYLEFQGISNEWVVDEGTWGTTNKVVLYYNTALSPKAKTPKIFTKVKINATASSGQALLEGANNKFDVIVAVDAVQSTVGSQTFSTAKEAFTAMM